MLVLRPFTFTNGQVYKVDYYTPSGRSMLRVLDERVWRPVNYFRHHATLAEVWNWLKENA